MLIVIMENRRSGTDHRQCDRPHTSIAWRSRGQFHRSSHAGCPSKPAELPGLVFRLTQGVTDNSCPLAFTNKANLASQLVAAKLSFTGFSEDLPSAGYTGCKADKYRRKHNPWVNFDNVASSSNQPFTAFPSTNLAAALPTVSIVVPKYVQRPP
ncbi:MAG: hypothetical protein IPL11_15690 [Candidatus Accumulibacter sp.]|nr:hypothetical protein [Accumulibacter sp.]